jgi:hypothetical protein
MVKTLAALIVSVCIAFSAIAAQSKVDKKIARPAWTELTPPQQQVLAPLQMEWEQLDTTRRKKWVSIADRYRTMKPPEQERLQKRMQEWAKLTPAQRKAAREKYQTLKKNPQKRDEVKRRWEEYEQSRATPPAGAPVPAPVTIQTPSGGG